MNIRKLNKNSTSAMTLLELLIAISIIFVLITAAGLQIKGLIQRAKVSAAKTTILGFGLCLSMVKDDTGLYPENLADLDDAGPPATSGDAKFSSRSWYGPYEETLSLTDPWGNEYFYELQDIVFGPQDFERTAGKPYEETFTFSAFSPTGTLTIQNPGVTSGSVILNGEEIVSEDEFKKIIPRIVKEINLLATNTITIKLASAPGITITISISAGQTSKNATFTLLSKGRDGELNTIDDIEYGEF